MIGRKLLARKMNDTAAYKSRGKTTSKGITGMCGGPSDDSKGSIPFQIERVRPCVHAGQPLLGRRPARARRAIVSASGDL